MLNKKGFSLIEMLVAMAIFVMFTGVLINSYMGIVGSLRAVEEERVLYSEARHVMDVLVEESRNVTVYGAGGSGAGGSGAGGSGVGGSVVGGSVGGGSVGGGSVAGGSVAGGSVAGGRADCNLYGFDVGDVIEFCSLDGTRKVSFEYKDEALYVSEYEKNAVEGLVKEDFVKISDEKLHSDEVSVTDFDFYVWPKENPYSFDGVEVSSMFQPKVTFVATFEKEGEGAFDLQTSISLRTYN